MKSAYEGKEKLISSLMVWGAGSFLGGLVVGFIGIILQSVIFFGLSGLLVVGGIAMGIGALGMGMGHNRTMDSGISRPQQEARVVARFAINDIGEMIFDNYDFDAEDARFYVRVQYLNGKREEFECARPVFDQAGEGMRGLLTISGGWLSMFNPLLDNDETKAAYRDW
jgi:hypothetical protein